MLTSLFHFATLAFGLVASIVFDIALAIQSDRALSIQEYAFSGTVSGYITTIVIPFLVIKYVYDHEIGPMPLPSLIDRVFGGIASWG